MNIAALFSSLKPGLQKIGEDIEKKKLLQKEEERYKTQIAQYEERARMDKEKWETEQKENLLKQIDLAAKIFATPTENKPDGNIDGFEQHLNGIGVNVNHPMKYIANGWFNAYKDMYNKNQYDKMTEASKWFIENGETFDPTKSIEANMKIGGRAISERIKTRKNLEEDLLRTQIASAKALGKTRDEGISKSLDDFFQFAEKNFKIPDPNNIDQFVGIDWERAGNSWIQGRMAFARLLGLGNPKDELIQKNVSMPISESMQLQIEQEPMAPNIWTPSQLEEFLTRMNLNVEREDMKRKIIDFFTPKGIIGNPRIRPLGY
jgi:hypothetical protein